MQEKTPNDEITLRGVRITFRNFAGVKRPFNDEGKRNFSVVLDEGMAAELEKLGLRVKRKEPRIEGEDGLIHLPVAVNYNFKPPRITMIGEVSGKRTMLNADTCGLLDVAELVKVDLTVRARKWGPNGMGASGVKAYLKVMFATIAEDVLELEYDQDDDHGDESPY